MVVDASLLLATMLNQTSASFAQATLGRMLTVGGAAPALLPFEIANVLERQRRRGAVTSAQRTAQLRLFSAYGIALEAAPDASALSAIGATAEHHGLSGYDAAYLELAVRLGAELATLDADLAAAGQASGLVVHHA